MPGMREICVYFRLSDDLNRPKRVGRLVLAARVLSGLSQSELGEKIGSSRGVISRIENGQLVPDVTLTADIAKATGQDFRIFEV